jgi:hypothetical protein
MADHQRNKGMHICIALNPKAYHGHPLVIGPPIEMDMKCEQILAVFPFAMGRQFRLGIYLDIDIMQGVQPLWQHELRGLRSRTAGNHELGGQNRHPVNLQMMPWDPR